MKTIHKYQLNYGITPLELQQGAIPIHADMQNGVPTIWVEVNGQLTRCVEYSFYLIGTGHLLPESISYDNPLKHINSFMEGPLVWHVYYQLGE